MSMYDDDSYFVDNDEEFQEMRQGIVDVIYGHSIQKTLAVMRDIWIVTLAQMQPHARWLATQNFKNDAAKMLVESNAMAEDVRRDPSLVTGRERHFVQ